jgi:very-short-patch-repair endonuclease
VAEIAARQRGVVTNADLRGCGLTYREIERWVKDGHLHEKHRGVYAVGHRELTVEGRWLAAVKACGEQAALSHYAAAALWGLVEWDGRRIDVTATTTRRHAGVRTHRTTRPDRTLHKHIPVTSVLRTLDDLSSVLPFKPFRRAVRNAFNKGLITTAEVARAKSKPLRAIAADIVPTESILEDYVHDLIREAGFEEPLVNVPLGDYRPDFRWPHRALIVEADGAGTHDNDLARLDDALRTLRLPDRVVRVTWRQAVLQPANTVARLRALREATGSAAVRSRAAA